MLADRDPNASGRTSRASNMSAMSRATHKHTNGTGKQDLLASAPGVMSMLRTTTEMGNLGGLTNDLSGGDTIPRAPSRRGASSRLSIASSMSGTSSRASRHYRQWPSSSSAVRRSSSRELSGPQYVADTLSPTLMDIQGSSPLVPTRLRSRNNGNGHRSFSMTTAMQPSFRLASNRSLGSLRGHEQMQRPRPPYAYPTRLRRPSHRPSSPPLSDSGRSHLRRLHSRGSQGQVYSHGQTRQRMPFDTNPNHQDGKLHRRPSGVPQRAPYSDVYGDAPPLPPVPPLFYPRMPVEQVRAVHRSAKGSFSSGSTNRRTDSDAPSSDLPSPPTPREGSSLEVLLTRTSSQVLIETVTGVSVKDHPSDGPLYYDYSEQFEHTKPADIEVASVPSEVVHDIKVMREECGMVQPLQGTDVEAVDKVGMVILDAVELPASPISKRITRDLVLQVLEAPSSTVDSNTSGGVLADKTIVQHAPSVAVHTTHGQQSSMNTANGLPTTPKALGTGNDLRPSTEPDRSSFSSPGVAPSTEADMSDLLAGYQHTEEKQDEFIQDGDSAAANTASSDEGVQKRNGHAQKLSDEQSFKSCADSPEPKKPQTQSIEQDARSFKSCTDMSNDEKPNIKAPVAHSLRSCNLGTSSRSFSVPASSLPSIDLASAFHTPRPFSEAQLISPCRAVLKKTCDPTLDPNFDTAGLQSSSQLSIKQTLQSAIASSATLTVAQQPPTVPPRDSSASKEAQRSLAVGSWMLRSLRWGKRQSKNEETTRPRECEKATQTPVADAPHAGISPSSPLPTKPIIATPDKVLLKRDFVQLRQTPASGSLQSYASLKASSGNVGSTQHQHTCSNLVSTAPEASSVYSPQQSSLRSRVHSSPAGVPGSSAGDRPDSQTTTHLIWHSQNNHALPPASASEPHLRFRNDQEDSTTDLRLSQYRYNNPLHYLPDLKEESHEDSSLNTSASNLKCSNFRFPFGVPLGVRASVDDGVRFSRRSSLGSQPRGALGSALAQAHGLPSMNFSRMNLLEKLNEEFGLHSSRSLDAIRPISLDQCHGSPQRPMSAGETDKRCSSSIAKPDQLFVAEMMPPATETADVVIVRRTQSPELLAEIDRLTIPSVGGLTQRISEFLPSLRDDCKVEGQEEFPAEEVIMEHAMEEIHDIGGPVQKRSSARLRAMPGSPDMVVVEDALYEDLIGKEKEGSCLGGQGDDERARPDRSEGASTEGVGKTVPHIQTHKETSLSKLRAPSSSIVRTQSHTVGSQAPRVTVESKLLHSRSLRSFASTSRATDTQPWNSDKSYPWATTTIPSVDISLPPPATERHSPLPGPSHLRNRISNASTASTLALNTPVGSPLEGSSATSAQACRLHHFSIFGANSDQSHAAGERYPTSALTPPTAIFRDHFSASDTSDDETEPPISRKGRFSLKKRFSSARKATLEISTRAASKKTTPPSPSPRDIALPDLPASATSILEDNAGEASAFTATNRHTFRDAEGMRSATYHRYRLVDHLKRWWHKSGDLFRRLSTRS